MENLQQDADAPQRERLRLYHLGFELEKLRKGELKQLCLSHGRTRQGLSLSMIGMLLRRVPELNLFCKFAQANDSVQTVVLDVSVRGAFLDQDQDDNNQIITDQEYYERWDKVSQGLGFLQGLRELRIVARDGRHVGEVRTDYRALALILKRLP